MRVLEFKGGVQNLSVGTIVGYLGHEKEEWDVGCFLRSAAAFEALGIGSSRRHHSQPPRLRGSEATAAVLGGEEEEPSVVPVGEKSHTPCHHL